MSDALSLQTFVSNPYTTLQEAIYFLLDMRKELLDVPDTKQLGMEYLVNYANFNKFQNVKKAVQMYRLGYAMRLLYPYQCRNLLDSLLKGANWNQEEFLTLIDPKNKNDLSEVNAYNL